MCEKGQLTDLEIEILEGIGLNKGREDLKTRKMRGTN